MEKELNIDDKDFLKKVKEVLTKDTLLVAWVLKKIVGSFTKFELRCNRCEQFPKGYFETSDANNAREAKKKLYKKLVEIELSGVQKV